MQQAAILDLSRRFAQNPLLTPKDITPSRKEMVVECLLNPGVFRFDKKIWLLIRVAECPEQIEGYVRIARHQDGEIEILQFDKVIVKSKLHVYRVDH